MLTWLRSVYEVEVKDMKRKDKNTTIVKDSEVIKLTNLRPFTTYKIKIIACNERVNTYYFSFF